MNLYYCQATSAFGIFGDHIWADSKLAAELAFQNLHHCWPHYVICERRAK